MTTLLLMVSLVASIGILFWLIRYGRQKTPNTTAFIKDVLVPVSTPLMVAVVGIIFTLQSSEQLRQDAAKTEKQQQLDKEATVMRDLVVSQERRDIAYLTAVDTEMLIHLTRYGKSAQEDFKAFDEEAIFYFYGLHRAELVNLAASRGEFTFSRLWIEYAFQALADDVVTQVLGATETDPAVSPLGEAVIYKYFHNSPVGDNQNGETTSLLADFHDLLGGARNSRLTEDQAVILKKEFQNYQTRLKNGQLKTRELIYDIYGMTVLDVYCYNNIFAEWYGVKQADIPTLMPSDPPPEFLASFPRRQDAISTWQRIRDLVKAMAPSYVQ